MRRVVAALLAAVAAVQGVSLQQGMALLDMAPPRDADGPHGAFVADLTRARDLFTNVSSTLSHVEQMGGEGEGEGASMALSQLASGIALLRRVRADVAASASGEGSIPLNVRMQVAWDIDRIVSDAERLRSASLAPLARTALMKALQLRFSVLLTPAFWTTPIKRDLIYMDETTKPADRAGVRGAMQQQEAGAAGGRDADAGEREDDL